jgi:ribonuclease PH
MAAVLSALDVTAYPSITHYRYQSHGTEVLAAILGPYESRATKKADYKQVHVDVVISHLGFAEDTAEMESRVKACIESLICGEQYPYLAVMVNIQVIKAGQGALLPACLNAAYMALLESGLALKHGLYAEEVSGVTIALVPDTSLVIQSLGNSFLSKDAYVDAVRQVYRHSRKIPKPL